MRLASLCILQPLTARAERQIPIRADLSILVACLQRVIMERVALRIRTARRPDHRFVRIREAAAAEIRHRIGFAPDNIVQEPEAEILHDRANAENIMVGADHPERRIRFHHTTGSDQPCAGEGVIIGKTGKLVPVIIHRIDQ